MMAETSVAVRALEIADDKATAAAIEVLWDVESTSGRSLVNWCGRPAMRGWR